MTPLVLLDLVLGAVVLGLVAATLWSGSRARMTMLFIGFGGVVALVWMRLGAPDVALAEAAVGAALTGALILRAQGSVPAPLPERSRPWIIRGLVAGLSVAVFGALAWALISLDWKARPELERVVEARLPESGVTNPVTAVLLNFRAYDTLLEMAVLLIATAAVWCLGRSSETPQLPPDDPLNLALLRPLVPLLCIVAGYLLWLGAFAPGGAFQAGAVLSGALLLLLVAGLPRAPGQMDTLRLRATIAAALLVFLGVAAATAMSEATLLQYLFMCFPLWADGREALAAFVYLAVAHAFAKSALFLACEQVQRTLGDDQVSSLSKPELPGAVKVTFALAAVSLVGLPPSGGFIGKWLLLESTLSHGLTVWTVIVLCGTLLSAAAMARVLARFFAPEGQAAAHPQVVGDAASWRFSLTPLLLAVAAVGIGLLGAWTVELVGIVGTAQ